MFEVDFFFWSKPLKMLFAKEVEIIVEGLDSFYVNNDLKTYCRLAMGEILSEIEVSFNNLYSDNQVCMKLLISIMVARKIQYISWMMIYNIVIVIAEGSGGDEAKRG